ncbi:C39 family peptidase [Myceligenerans crystallogenes]|uniref:Peptidase C39-like domain-containing protein n=1 Tax=Myceligenerans crystallogenes TaxID=316335 RepID=A0ABN2NL61_9MICO
MLTVRDISTGALEGAGLLPIGSYDPFQPRFIANLKEHLATGYPVVVRLHPGVAYPMPDHDLVHKVDREGHVVTVVGYDDENDTFLIGDPWRAEWGGDRHGLTTLTAQDMTLLLCNSTACYAAMPAPMTMSARIEAVGPTTNQLVVTVGTPRHPHARCELRSITDLNASIKLPAGLAAGQTRQWADLITPDGDAEITWVIEEHAPADGEIEIAVAGLGAGYDPYPFTDVVGSRARIAVRSVLDAPVRERQLA